MLRVFSPFRPRGRVALATLVLGLAAAATAPAKIEPPVPAAAPAEAANRTIVRAADLRALLDARPALAPDLLRLGANPPLPPALRPVPSWEVASREVASAAPTGPVLAAAPPAATAPSGPIPDRVGALLPTTRAEARRLAQGAPSTPPGEVSRAPAIAAARPADRPAARRIRAAALPAPQPQGSFVERLLGLQAAPGPALAYAALPSNPAEAVPAEQPGAASGAGVAVYDISARTVTLPGGERLEAHSGLGPAIDDPRYVHLRMRGATPPGTYDLTERAGLFHGVRALRLNPVGGSAAVHGRAGLLAHTFMLGPNGDSNGCVSFRQYDRFLAAYLRGEIRRLVVVAGRQDGLPGLVGRLFGARERPAGSGRGA